MPAVINDWVTASVAGSQHSLSCRMQTLYYPIIYSPMQTNPLIHLSVRPHIDMGLPSSPFHVNASLISMLNMKFLFNECWLAVFVNDLCILLMFSCLLLGVGGPLVSACCWTAFDETIQRSLAGKLCVRGMAVQTQGRSLGGQGHAGSLRWAFYQRAGSSGLPSPDQSIECWHHGRTSRAQNREVLEITTV